MTPMAAVNPEGIEAPSDGVDSNCDGLEQCYIDADNDGYRTTDEAVARGLEAIDCDEDGVATSEMLPRQTAMIPNEDPSTLDRCVEVSPETEVDGDCNTGVEMCYADAGWRWLAHGRHELVQSEDADMRGRRRGRHGDAPLGGLRRYPRLLRVPRRGRNPGRWGRSRLRRNRCQGRCGCGSDDSDTVRR